MSLNQLFHKLEVDASQDNHKEVLETTYEILKSSPNDLKAMRLSIVAAINLDQYLKAYGIFKEFPQQGDDLLLEKLYVIYKLNLNDELHQEFNKLTPNQLNNGVLHLKAQFYYRLGDYETALTTYHQLIQSTDSEDPELLDLSVNERAILADGYQFGIFNKFNDKQPLSDDQDSYDLVFNESLIQFGLKNYTKSLELLELSLDKAIEVNTDLNDQLNETFPILLQKAYLYQTLGETIKAKEILESIDISKISDDLNTLIYQNNLITLTSTENPALIIKELEFPNSLNKLNSRLSLLQKTSLWKNYNKLKFKLNQSITSKDLNHKDITNHALKSFSKSGLDHDDLITQAKQAYRFAINTKDLGISLISAQLNIELENFDSAVSILENLNPENKYLPSVSNILINLYEKLGSQKKKISLFNEIYEFYKSKDLNIDEYEFLKVISLNFSNQEPEKTQNLLEKLYNIHPDDLISIILNKSEKDLNQLHPIDHLTSGLSFDDLIQQGIESLSQQQPILTTKKTIKKRSKQSRKPSKSYDATKQPDGERWLPMKDRSYYKPPKGKKKQGNQTQGGVADNITEESFNKVSKPVQVKKNKKKGRK
ncbi:Signal recognition particle protein [Wickerhamomyces ciferrii]|uniref:Signal recognition particle subunit SRP72 n=1 Tax=Wickerhamomyces ciferrii (strain ATCC 14091 / BCRC 22168 / CBS 111 / JCM 3599 / NBRC 0793 / NRRL Y-1031 F-60-10) TaxID=1206466 RepID=K0KX39_WICCF|nr:Signal recognition particle protein [Wickerhamomyces ciferrii]CCH45658.1 Signal recognition particle protein [Wickerhamomyces ciferrii]